MDYLRILLWASFAGFISPYHWQIMSMTIYFGDFDLFSKTSKWLAGSSLVNKSTYYLVSSLDWESHDQFVWVSIVCASSSLIHLPALELPPLNCSVTYWGGSNSDAGKMDQTWSKFVHPIFHCDLWGWLYKKKAVLIYSNFHDYFYSTPIFDWLRIKVFIFYSTRQLRRLLVQNDIKVNRDEEYMPGQVINAIQVMSRSVYPVWSGILNAHALFIINDNPYHIKYGTLWALLICILELCWKSC
mgnify:FL=1